MTLSHDARFDEDALAVVRRAYARQILAAAGVAADAALEQAFATVRRERFLGPPPWRISAMSGPITLESPDPVVAYQDVLFALLSERGINNGSPTLHARWLHRAGLKPGERVVHVGVGTGYYTAVIAHLVGPKAHITAIEHDSGLAQRAETALAGLGQVDVVAGDGAAWPREETDCIYVNASVGRPAPAWLDRLAIGGRLIFPLGVARTVPFGAAGGRAQGGAGFCITRRDRNRYVADWLGPAFFVRADGDDRALTGSEREREALRAAFDRGGCEFVRSLRWQEPPSPNHSWFAGLDWSLSYEDVG